MSSTSDMPDDRLNSKYSLGASSVSANLLKKERFVMFLNITCIFNSNIIFEILDENWSIAQICHTFLNRKQVFLPDSDPGKIRLTLLKLFSKLKR